MVDTTTAVREDGNLVKHAIQELELLGQTAEDPAFAASLVDAVRAFASYGHSGGSAFIGVAMLRDLLSFRPLSALTTSEDEWTDVAEQSGIPLWQSKRHPAAFCEGQSPEDGSAIFYVLGDRSERVPLTPVDGHLTDTTTATKTETELLDRLDELGFISVTIHRSDPAITTLTLAWHAGALAPNPGHPVAPTYVNGSNGRYSTTRQDPNNLGHLHVGHYGPTRYDALTALVALAEQQADR